MNIRFWVLRSHRWSGLVVGSVIVLVVLSGAAAVLRADVERWCGLREVPATGRGPFNPEITAITAAYPGVKLDLLFPADAPGRPDTHQVSLVTPAGKHHFSIFCDPVDGHIIGDTREAWMASAIGWIAEFHTTLFLPDEGHEFLQGLVAVALFGFSCTGFWLWWTGATRIRDDLRSDRLCSLRVNAVHRLIAVATLPFLLLCAYTALLFSWHWTRPVLYAVLGSSTVPAPYFTMQDPEKLVFHDEGKKPQLGVDELIAAARAHPAAAGTDRVLRVTSIGSRATKPVKVTLDYPGNGDVRSGGVVFHLGRGTGVAAFVDDPRDASIAHWLLARQWSLHTGRWGSSASVLGACARLAWIVGGLAIAVVVLTGAASWWSARRRPTSGTT